MERQLVIVSRKPFPYEVEEPDKGLRRFFMMALSMATAHLEVDIGPKEYIDEIRFEDLKAPVTLGKDQFGRYFFAIVCEVLVDGIWEKTSYVVFNRYRDNPSNWQGADSENSLVSPRPCFPPSEAALFSSILKGAKDRKLTSLDHPAKKKWLGCPVRLWEM